MDDKTYRQIVQEDHITLAKMQKIMSFMKFGFTFFSHKKGFHVHKEVSKYCLREFDFVFPTLDAAIFYVEGYTQARLVPGEGSDGPSGDSGGGDRQPYQRQFH